MFAGTSMVASAQIAQNSAPAATNMSMNPEQEQAFRDGQEALKMDTAAKRKIDATTYSSVRPPTCEEKQARGLIAKPSRRATRRPSRDLNLPLLAEKRGKRLTCR